MRKLHINNETSTLQSVILGIADDIGPTPSPEEAYDPKSLENILAGTYPKQQDMQEEIKQFKEVLEKYEVEVLQPKTVKNVNQIFTRDIAFVIDQTLIKANILPDRAQEWDAIGDIIDELPAEQVVYPPEEVHIEGGDIMPWNNYLLVGTYNGDDYAMHNTARTNSAGVNFLRRLFPTKEVIALDLIKSSTDPRANALHLDCCFQPVGVSNGIICKEGFRQIEDYEILLDIFGEKNLFHISREEMYHMFSNVFSISPEVVVSEKNFSRLNTWLRAKGLKVEEINYHEIGKQGGLLRCSTLPLYRV